jgi:type VI secretion system protein ImpC
VLPGADPQQAQLVAAMDAGIGDQMRGILKHPAFRELEAAWRSLHGLVTSLETGEELKLFLLDVSRDELAADLDAADSDARGSGLYASLVDRSVRTLGGQPWSLIVGNFRFGAVVEDVALLGRLGALASQAGGPFLAAADPVILGCDSLAATPDPEGWASADTERDQRWRTLRTSRPASWIGLALPRLLLRLPYGEKTEEIERFEFEELSAPPEHESYLWGNPAFACARLLAQAFQARGGSMEPGDYLDIEDLPAHVYQDAGEAKMTPCAEVFLTERAAAAILDRGVMPVMSYRDRNAARLARFQSLADPPAGLPGPWA